jgi:hypothetical protein
MIRTFRIPVLAAASLVALGGCTLDRDPMDRPGTWQPTGANEHNLRAMVATPSHLDRGIGASTDRGQAGSLAATRLFTDRRRRLPAVGASSVAGGQQAQQAADPPVTGPGSGSGGGGASR